MNWSTLQLRSLALLGPTKAPANIDFRAGVNVICGASDTGKSFIVEAIDFFLGGIKPLRDIPERIGYDRGRISVLFNDDIISTFEQSTEGGEYKKYDGKLNLHEFGENWTKIKSKHAHGKDDNLSGLFLSKIGLFEKYIRKNARGDTHSLSFRDLARLIIVQEIEIIKRDSPFLTGQYVTRTSESSVLKLLLTGVDDSSLVSETKPTKTSSIPAKIELIEQWEAELQTEIEDMSIKREDIESQIKHLEKSIINERENLDKSQKKLDSFIKSRRELYSQKEKIKDRISEINELLSRFDLLNSHYKIDIDRLQAIQESGSLFIHQEIVPCPLCGALPEHQHNYESKDEDVEVVIHAAKVEIEKINRLSIELTKTVKDLKEELDELNNQIVLINKNYKNIDEEIRETISPNLGDERTVFEELIDKRSELRDNLELFEKIDRLGQQKRDLLKENDISIISDSSQTDLSKTVLDEFAEQIEKLLKAWHFPDAERVFFDEKDFDFIINGKPRASRGKGLRAITHAAVTIGLMEFCKNKSLPHPGFVVLDSPLLSYWEPEGPEDDLTGTDLKDRFYEYLVSEHKDTQIIIIENEHPSKNLLDKLTFTDFTKNPHQGRYGFFPIL